MIILFSFLVFSLFALLQAKAPVEKDCLPAYKDKDKDLAAKE